VTLTTAQMPSHTHNIPSGGAHTHTGLTLAGSSTDDGDAGNLVITAFSGANGTQNNAGTATSTGSAHTHVPDNTGGGTAHTNMQPTIFELVIIKL